MMISRIAACRSKHLCQPQIFLRACSSKGNDGSSDSHETLQGQPTHGFAPSWERDSSMSQANDVSQNSNHEQVSMGVDSHGHIGPKDIGTDTIGNGPIDNHHMDSYQHSSNVSLYSTMQSQVPHPYDHSSPTHMNMPHGGQTQNHKFISGMRIDAHPSHQPLSNGLPKVSFPIRLLTGAAGGGSEGEPSLSQKDKLKRAVKEYGSTVVVFHVGISLISLGGFYLAVSSGLDVVALLQKLGVGESMLSSSVATGASTFVIAYAVHKVFAPARIACTLTATPFIVRYLRARGILKPPKVKK